MTAPTLAELRSAARDKARALFDEHHAACGGHRERWENHGTRYQDAMTDKVLDGIDTVGRLFAVVEGYRKRK